MAKAKISMQIADKIKTHGGTTGKIKTKSTDEKKYNGQISSFGTKWITIPSAKMEKAW